MMVFQALLPVWGGIDGVWPLITNMFSSPKWLCKQYEGNPQPLKQPEIRYSSSTSILGTEKKSIGDLRFSWFDEGRKNHCQNPRGWGQLFDSPRASTKSRFQGSSFGWKEDNQNRVKEGLFVFFVNFHGGLMLYLYICIYIDNIHYFCSYGCFHSCMFCCCWFMCIYQKKSRFPVLLY